MQTNQVKSLFDAVPMRGCVGDLIARAALRAPVLTPAPSKAVYSLPTYPIEYRAVDCDVCEYTTLTGAQFEQGEAPTIEPIALDSTMLGMMLD